MMLPVPSKSVSTQNYTSSSSEMEKDRVKTLYSIIFNITPSYKLLIYIVCKAADDVVL